MKIRVPVADVVYELGPRDVAVLRTAAEGARMDDRDIPEWEADIRQVVQAGLIEAFDSRDPVALLTERGGHIAAKLHLIPVVEL